jgi:hypothetical protein
MELDIALQLFEIYDKYDDLSLEFIHKRYKKIALKYHPDKNGNTPESTEHFQKINEAYNYLKMEFANSNTYSSSSSSSGNFTPNSIYLNVLTSFMSSVMEGKYNELVANVVHTILFTGKHITLTIFENLEKDTALSIYIFLSRYKSILNINEELLENVKQLVIQKYQHMSIYKLNPTIDDIMNNNLYKLYIEEQLFLVPLWHKECYYETADCEIIVMCEPELPSHIKIDDENNLMVEMNIYAYFDLPHMIINNIPIQFSLGNKVFEISLEKLNIKKEQYYRIKNKGLTNFQKNIYELTEEDRGDIIIKINLI